MLDENLSYEKINKEVENEPKQLNEKKGSSIKGKLSEESQDKSISQMNTLCSSELASPLFSSLKTDLSTQQSSLQDNISRPSLTQKYILSSLSDQRATKIIQNMLMKEATKENIDSIVNELSGTYRNVMKNKNGNYLFSDLVEVCDQQQRIKILKEITKNISEDCADHFGTHPIQTLIKYSSSEEEYKLILYSFDYNALFYAALDPNGSYVVQKIIEHIPERFRKKFNLFFIQLICFLSSKKFGVVCAKKFCSCTKNEETIEQILNLIKTKFLDIATNQFGNFLIQHILEIWNNTSKGSKIKEEIISNFKIMYYNKYSTHICKLFLKLASMEEKNLLINKLKFTLSNNNDNLNLIAIILQSNMSNMGFMNMNNIPNNNFMSQNFGNNNNQNNFMNQNQFPISLNNYNNNNFMNQNQIHILRRK